MIAWFVASHLISRFVGGGLLKLFLGNLTGDLKKLWGWLCHRSFWQLMFGAALLLAGFEYIGKRAEQRHNVKVEAQLSKLIAAREADRRAYVKAQSDAAAQNKAQVAKVEQQQQKVTDDVETRYRADVARLHAEQLRPQTQRPTSGSGVSEGSTAPGGPGGEAVPLPGPELLRAQETELQLNALIDWVLAQSKVDPNKP